MNNLLGQKFGRLTIIKRVDNDKWRQPSVAEWAEEYSIRFGTLWTRIFIFNWSMEKALTEPV